MPKISVIMPIYNVDKYLGRCLDSILAQTFEDFKVICVNDGSPDTCGEILKKYSKKDKRIKVITQKNQGVSTARNNGLKEAKGEYICFVDADDEVSKRFLEELYFLINESKSDIASCDYLQSSDNPQWDDFNEGEVRSWDKVFERYILEELKISASIWGKLYRKDTFKEFLFNKDISIGEDLVYLYQCLYKTNKLATISQKLYFYRLRTGSAVNSRFSKKIIDGNVATAVELQKYFSNKELSCDVLKVLNQKIAKRIFKFCVLEPKRKDKKNLRNWYAITKPLLKKLLQDKIFCPKYLSIKNRIKGWLFFRGII